MIQFFYFFSFIYHWEYLFEVFILLYLDLILFHNLPDIKLWKIIFIVVIVDL